MSEGFEKERFKFGYQRSLDGLRAVAVMMVLVLHAFLPFSVARDVKIIGIGGFLGVDIFFVLSGFLITSLLLQEWDANDRIDFKKFYARRALRLLPALFVFVAACVVHSLIFRADVESGALRDVFAIVFYVSNWIPINLYSLRHTWSLAVEEQFYLLYPVFLLGLLLAARQFKIGRRTIIFLLALLIAAIAVYRAAMFANHGFSMRIYIGSDTRADSLLVGCLVGMLVSWNLLPRAPWFTRSLKAAALGAALVLGYMFMLTKFDGAFLYYGGFTLVAALVGLIVAALQIAPPKIFTFVLERSTLVWIGRLSYGIYLWHKLVYMIVDQIMPMISIPSYTMQRIVFPFGLKIALSFAVAAVSYYLLEKPFLRLKKRFEAVSPDERKKTSEATAKDEKEDGRLIDVYSEEKALNTAS